MLEKYGHESGMFLFADIFDIIDTDGSGEIPLQEWANYKALGIANPAYAKASFEVMDTNGDGIVRSREEFLNCCYTTKNFSSPLKTRKVPLCV